MTTQQLRGAIVSRLADLFRILRERQRQPELGSNQAETHSPLSSPTMAKQLRARQFNCPHHFHRFRLR